MKETVPLVRIDQEVISPETFVNLNEKDKSNIARTEIIPPQLGQNHFGKIKIQYKTPIYKQTK